MSDDIRVGDRFMVEVEVTFASTAPHSDYSVSFVGASDEYDADLPHNLIRNAKRIARAIKVDDPVIVDGSHPAARVLAIDGDQAWVLYQSGIRSTADLSDLTLADEAAS